MPYDKDSFLAGLAAGFASRTMIKPAKDDDTFAFDSNLGDDNNAKGQDVAQTNTGGGEVIQ